MSELSRVPAGYVPPRVPPRGENGVVAAILLSAGIALVGLVVGIRLMLERSGTPCPPSSSQLRCSTYPHMTAGLLVILFVLLVEIGVALSGVAVLIALRVLDRRPEASAPADRP